MATIFMISWESTDQILCNLHCYLGFFNLRNYADLLPLLPTDGGRLPATPGYGPEN